jgi:hypothetical protein
LLNYDHQVPAENMTVRLDLSGLVPDVSRWVVNALSPDAAQPHLSHVSLRGSVAEFSVNRIEHCTVVTLSPSPAP